MPSHSSFAKHIVQMVREMPDDALLALIREHLGVASGPSPISTVKDEPASTSKVESAPRARVRRASLDQQVKGVVASSDQGLALQQIADAVGGSKSRVSGILRRLRDGGEVAMAGERRFARYGRTLAIAEAANRAARGATFGEAGWEPAEGGFAVRRGRRSAS